MHGLTGTPAVMNCVVERLANAGFIVRSPLLPGHGTNAKELSKIKWKEWAHSVKTAYNKLREETDKISCVGLSLGSLLALNLALDEGADISAVVAMGTPLVLTWPIEYLAYPVTKYTPVRFFYKYQRKDWAKSVAEPGGRQYYVEHSYETTPICSVFEIYELKRIVRSKLSRLKVPLLIIHGQKDRVTPIRNVGILRRLVGPTTVETLILPNSEHVLVLDYDKETAINATVAFLGRFT